MGTKGLRRTRRRHRPLALDLQDLPWGKREAQRALAALVAEADRGSAPVDERLLAQLLDPPGQIALIRTSYTDEAELLGAEKRSARI